jgi:transposase InsO family protein
MLYTLHKIKVESIMCWKKTNEKDEKLMFICDWLKDEFDFSFLCKRYGISRPTGYSLINRYKEEKEGAFQEKSRAPHKIPHKTKFEIEAELIRLKHRYPNWGPSKVKDYLTVEKIPGEWPAASTIGEIYKRHGLVKSRRRRKKVPAHSEPLKHCTAPNEVWSADFKGHFILSNGKYCYPLTITDNYSRFIFACDGFESPNHENSIRTFERIFAEYGLPEAIRTDNGQPFCGLGIGGLTKLSIWFLKLGIMPERIDFGSPQQNGRHERMHRTLKESAISPGKNNLIEQQKIFDNFIKEFNTERPHQALNSKRPHEVHVKSIRALPSRMHEVCYPDGFIVRKVKMNGEVQFEGKKYYVSELLHKEQIGLERIDDNRAIVYFSKLKLGILDTKLDKIIRP